MEKVSLNQNWNCYKKGQEENSFPVTLPHDAMMLDAKSHSSAGGTNNGWIQAEDYTYTRQLFIPDSYQDKQIFLEFEGVYHNAVVSVNGQKITSHEYGYTGFYVEPGDALRYGMDNQIKVEVNNHDQPNSRWYTGTGIYRPVWMYVLPQEHIKLQGIRITTLNDQEPRIKVDVKLTGAGHVKVEILDEKTVIWTETKMIQERFSAEIKLPDARLWSVEKPKLYLCRVTYGEDIQEDTFGIRLIQWDEVEGFRINGERIILRGACIHHDNGLLGACAYDFAEERKVRILKENGYNAIRSAHNPCSKALLKACDELGMLVVDEYVDGWYIHKTKYDYADYVEDNYQKDLKDMVDKDYNHPSVVMYSTGNEVSETAYQRGIKLCGEMTEYLHQLDSSRPVTCGVNIFFNFLSSMGFGVYSDEKASQENGNSRKKVGSEFFNTIAGVFGSGFMKFGASLYPCDVKTRDAFANMDIAGYNYGINRYRSDLKKYPKRLILGSETFCSDASRFLELAKENKRIIGDFVWSGMDYLGELGIGAWEYKDYAPDFSHGPGWVSAGAGRIDLTGKPLAEMKYMRVAFGLDKIGLGVVPVKYAKQSHSPSAWKMSNALESWSFAGCEGMETRVEVYAKADHVSLYVNGNKVGTQKVKNGDMVAFKTRYYDGEVKAIAYDKQGKIIAETIHKTAGKETVLMLEPEQKRVKKGQDLCYLRIKYTDKEGVVKPLERSLVKVSIEGGKLLGLGSASPYYPRGYHNDTADTYYGEALAIIQPLDSEKIIVHGKSALGEDTVEIKVE